MLIALLALLGVDLIVLVGLAAFVLGRKRWVAHQPGAFRGAIRSTGGEVDGLSAKWRRGYGRWVGDVLVWTKGPLLFRNEVLKVDRKSPLRSATVGEVKRLGDDPEVLRAEVDGMEVEIAADSEDAGLLANQSRVQTAM